jgi:hypothetical protein
MGERPVVIRTLDLGADKKTSILEFPFEENPFLGYRAIRFCLQNSAVFKTQLRALLRASAAAGNIKIMYPMIPAWRSMMRLRRFSMMYSEENRPERKANNPRLEVGVMIEILQRDLCGELARKAYFFQHRPQALIQYDGCRPDEPRTQNYLYKPTHPAISAYFQYGAGSSPRNGHRVSLSVLRRNGGDRRVDTAPHCGWGLMNCVSRCRYDDRAPMSVSAYILTICHKSGPFRHCKWVTGLIMKLSFGFFPSRFAPDMFVERSQTYGIFFDWLRGMPPACIR